jgi:hypothetical protein
MQTFDEFALFVPDTALRGVSKVASPFFRLTAPNHPCKTPEAASALSCCGNPMKLIRPVDG